MSHRKTIVLGDLHLVQESKPELLADFAELCRRAEGQRLVFLGDLFDLSADHPGRSRKTALQGALEAQPRVRELLGSHTERGGELWIAAGNHDAALGDPELREQLTDLLMLSAPAKARLRTTPWFFREADLHLEHGHLFDPDNASAHPLSNDIRSLGVHFVEHFIAPTGAFRYLNSNDGTPLELFVSAFRWYGRRGPFVVYKYFDTAFRALLASGPFFRGARDELVGDARLVTHAANEGLDLSLLETLCSLSAAPTMSSLRSTFSRLYLDRVAGTVAVASGLCALAAGHRNTGLRLVGAGTLALSLSWLAGHDRYGGSVPELLKAGAAAISEASGAKLVVMGHAHREALSEGYANTGSFSFPRDAPGRPYLEIEQRAGRSHAVAHHLVRA